MYVTQRRVRANIVAVENSITYCESVFVALGMQHAMRLRHIFICGLPGSTKFFRHVPYATWSGVARLLGRKER